MTRLSTRQLATTWRQQARDRINVAANQLATLADDRAAAGITRRQLADESGYSLHQIRRIEAGGDTTQPAEVFELTAALDRLREANR